MKYLLIILSFIGWSACELPVPIFQDPDIIKVPPVPVDTLPLDSLPPNPIDSTDTTGLDTTPPCILTPVTEPKFITMVLQLPDGLPSTMFFHQINNNGIFLDLKSLLVELGFNQDSIVIYQKDSAMVAIIRGTNDKSKVDTKVYITAAPSGGTKYFFMASIQGFFFEGALTYQEYKEVALSYPSVRGFNFLYTHWTQEQYEEVATIILGDCKEGRDWADFRFNEFPISDQLYCLFIQRGWAIVMGQVQNCGPIAPPVITRSVNIAEYERFSRT